MLKGIHKYGAIGLAGVLVGAVAMIMTQAFGQGATTGSMALQPGSNLNVTCVNALTNANKTAHSETVKCAANSTTTTAAKTTTTVVRITTTTGTKTWSCVTSNINTSSNDSQCPQNGGTYRNYAGIVARAGSSKPIVSQDAWSAGGSKFHQTLYANSPGDWKVVVTADNPDGSVLTFPNVGWYPPARSVKSLTSITSSWNLTMPAVGKGTVGWAGYDLWFNGWNDEVMIQPDIVANSNYDCKNVASLTVSGVKWYMCQFGSERVWHPGPDASHYHNMAKGSLNILAFLKYMVNSPTLVDKLPSNSTFYAASFGFEVCNTSGRPATFRVNNFTWKAK